MTHLCDYNSNVQHQRLVLSSVHQLTFSLINAFRNAQKIQDNDFNDVKELKNTQFNMIIYDLKDQKIEISYSTSNGFKSETLLIEIFAFDNDIYTTNDDSNVQIDDSNVQIDNTFIKKSRLYITPKEISGKKKDYKIYFNELFRYHVFYRNLFGGFDCLFFEDVEGNKYITDMHFPISYYSYNTSDYDGLANGIRMIVREIKFINNRRLDPIYTSDHKKIILVLEIVVVNSGDDKTKGCEYKNHPSEYQSLYLRLLHEDDNATNITFMLINNKDEEVNKLRPKEYTIDGLLKDTDAGYNTDFKGYNPTGDDRFETDFDVNGYLKEGQLPNYFINKYPK